MVSPALHVQVHLGTYPYSGHTRHFLHVPLVFSLGFQVPSSSDPSLALLVALTRLCEVQRPPLLPRLFSHGICSVNTVVADGKCVRNVCQTVKESVVCQALSWVLGTQKTVPAFKELMAAQWKKHKSQAVAMLWDQC